MKTSSFLAADISRRGFLTATTAFAGEVVASSALAGPSSDAGFAEPPRTLPVETCDVIVAGGGPAGIAAAAAAARAGAKVKLFELHGALGGIWTNGFMGCMMDFNKSATDRELTRRLDQLAARCPRTPKQPRRYAANYVYEPEYMKLACEDFCREAGVDFLLHTAVVAAYRDASGRNIETVVTESKEGRRAWRAKVFIDCTGDGDLAARAGCGFDFGGVEGNDQPGSLCSVAVSPHPEEIAPFVVNHPSTFDDKGRQAVFPKTALLKELQRAGVDPTYHYPTLFMARPGIYVFIINHAYALPLDDVRAITQATVDARRETLLAARALERLGGPWEGFRVVATAEQIGHRAARRVHGLYTLTAEDVRTGARFPDAVTTSYIGVDIHATSRDFNRKKAAGSHGYKNKPFQIPLRACIAKDVDNLYLAGRCISGDFVSMASYRITGSAVAMGEAVGKEAAKRVQA